MQKVNDKHRFFKAFIFGLFLSFSAIAANTAGVSLSAVPTTQTVNVGQTATYTIKINRDNYTDKVTLSATALPAGASATFTPNTTTAASSTLTIKTLTTTPVGTFNINVKGTANGITIAPIVVKLITQPAPSISVAVTPSTQFIVAGQSTFYDIAISRFNYDGKLTLSAVNLPSGVTAFFEPESTYGNSSRMYLYSGGIPFLWKDYGMLVKANNPYDGIEKLVAVQLRVNYGMIWAAQFAAPNNQNEDVATDVTYDSAGNVYVTGYTYFTTTADNNSWVAKFDSAGNQLWLSMIPNLLDDKATDVFVDVGGNVYVAGSTRGLASDIFVVKFAANGVQISSTSVFSTVNEEGQKGMQFGVDMAGNTTLTAVMRVRISNTGQRDQHNDPATSGTFDVTRYTFDANFNRISTIVVTNAVGEPKDLTVGGDGSIYVLGEDHTQIIDNGFGALILVVTSQVEKFNASNGQSIYRSQPISPSTDNHYLGTQLKVDAQGNVFAIGTKLVVGGSAGRPSILGFVSSWFAKISSTGSVDWVLHPFQTYYQTEIKALDIDPSGNVYCAGYTYDTLRGSNPNRGQSFDVNARTDAFFSRYSGSSGSELNRSQFNVDNKDGFNAVKVGALSSGFLNSTLYFAGYTVNFKNVNFGNTDALLLQCSSFDCGYTP
ncbi:MAG: SBBP repeat-containing protein [Actinomycetota bacterium]